MHTLFLIISIQSLTNYFHYLYACIFDLSGRNNKNRRQTKYFSSPRSFSWCFSWCDRSSARFVREKKKKNLQEEGQETNFRLSWRKMQNIGWKGCWWLFEEPEMKRIGVARKEWEDDREKVLVVQAPL